eukprot:Protomagalhaensia_sp_Gyna_25__3359@NODE_3032_length_762_cov_2_990318_g2534_i0_p1_GENE_NODE_3032_length_762_cov_2_990318_g2534_i0NODE_3032_length_762_cov_2_990318_g2534_i0_p1_ORF_typecomplete_len234_score28_30_NODE_3032_length_762_cov_2_990318_g2534_i05706
MDLVISHALIRNMRFTFVAFFVHCAALPLGVPTSVEISPANTDLQTATAESAEAARVDAAVDSQGPGKPMEESGLIQKARESSGTALNEWNQLSELYTKLTLALNSLHAAHKAVSAKETRLIRSAREILSSVWLSGNSIATTAEHQQRVLGSMFPGNFRGAMEVLRIDKAAIQKADKLPAGDQRNLLCPSDCDPRFCSNQNIGKPTQCYKPRSARQLDLDDLHSDIDMGVECA